MIPLGSYVVRVIRLKDKNHVAIPLPPDVGMSEGDPVSITILEEGELLIKRVVDEEEIIKKLRDGVEAKGFDGEGVDDIIKSCKEWFRRH